MIIHKQKGESLLEVMISLLLFCVAILGLLGTQQRMLVQMFHTESVVVANQLANSLVEQLLILPASTALQLDASVNTLNLVSCPYGACNSAWINSRLSQWQQRLESELPGSEFQLCLDSTPIDGTPGQSLCSGGTRLAVKIWPKSHNFPITAALNL